MWTADPDAFQLITDGNAHLGFMCLSALACLAFAYLLQVRTAGPVKAVWLSLTEILLGEALGIFFAKGTYALIQMEYLTKLHAWGAYFTSLKMEELSFFGGVGGVVLAVFFSARIFALPPRRVLNRFAPAGALLIALVRFGEFYLQGEMLGVGEPTKIGLAADTVLSFPWGIAVDWFGDGSYMEYYLAVFMLEGFAALGAMLFALCRLRDRDCFIRTLFYICLVQILLESIRETSISLLFVRAEQLICFLYVEGILVLYAVRRLRKGKWYGILPPVLGLVAGGAVILIEFALQNKIDFMKDLGPMKMYLIMAAALLLPAAADVIHHINEKRMKKKPALR